MTGIIEQLQERENLVADLVTDPAWEIMFQRMNAFADGSSKNYFGGDDPIEVLGLVYMAAAGLYQKRQAILEAAA